MRIRRLIAVAAAASAVVLVSPGVASAREVSFMAPLSPSSGPNTTSITATYLFQPHGGKGPDGECDSETATFSWDGHLLGRVSATSPIGDWQRQGYCNARLTFTPPRGVDSPGPHVVAATNGRAAAQARFTVTGAAAPAPAPPVPGGSPTAMSSATAATRPSQTATQPTTPPSSAVPSTAAPASAEPLPSEEPAIQASPPVVDAAMNPPSGGSMATVIGIAVGVLTLAGAGVLIALAVRKRPDLEEIPADAATAES
jgi:hypothetical protein